MSIRHISVALDHYSGPASSKLVLLILADHAQPDTGNAWPTAAAVASRACMNERSARKVLAKLVDEGVVTVVHRGGRVINASARRYSNEPTVYHINVTALERMPVLRLRGRQNRPMPDGLSPVQEDTPSPVPQDTPAGYPHPDLQCCGQDTPSPVPQDTPLSTDSPVPQDTLNRQGRQRSSVIDSQAVENHPIPEGEPLASVIHRRAS